MYHYSVPPPAYERYDYPTSATNWSSPDQSYSYYPYETSSKQQPNRKYRTHTRTTSSSSVGSAGPDPPPAQGYTYTPSTYISPPTYHYRTPSSRVRPVDTRVDKDDVPTVTRETISTGDKKPRKAARLFKTKQGLLGSANGSTVAAMADTGSRKNVISDSYARRLNLGVNGGSPSVFKIGNGRKIRSTGTVSLLWAFAEEPEQAISILCHVLPRCAYDLVLGNEFLTATKTLTKSCHRLTRCLFSIVNNIPHFGFLGETSQRLDGTLGETRSVLAVPDTGAERNVMSLQYAVDHGFRLKTERSHCGYLQFADGSYDKTVGQVETSWTFASGERISVTFEVLEYCCSDVIIGEQILTDHNVFVEHATSIILAEISDDDGSYGLAPFDYMNSWQRAYKRIVDKAASKRVEGPLNASVLDNDYIQEQHRRNLWNYEYDFGINASEIEQQLELVRRERYKSDRAAMSAQPNPAEPSGASAGRPPSKRRIPVVPSLPTSQSPW